MLKFELFFYFGTYPIKDPAVKVIMIHIIFVTFYYFLV